MVAGSDVADVITLKPDPGLVRSLGAHHTLESALADLVDNCLDAEASRVSIRLLTKDDRLVQVEVVDNGRGMSADTADEAMTLGHQREYADDDLGHFGVGLKAASFGQCDVLTVWSSAQGADPVGRRIRKADFSRDFACERLTTRSARTAETRRYKAIQSKQGTTIVWTSLHGTYEGANAQEARTWIAEAERSLRSHLGLTFHRLIQKERLTLDVLVDEINQADDAIGTPVAAVDPFGYTASGCPGYPKTLVARAGGKKVALHCHIWPGKTDIPGFRIQGKQGERFQGLFIYRNDRLLTRGGWSEVINSSRQRQLARVVIDDASAIGTFVRMNPEKSGVRLDKGFRDALARATAADGTTFGEYIEQAEMIYGEANRRSSRRQPVITPSRGFAPKLRKQISTELPLIKTAELNIQWKLMRKGEFISVDVTESVLFLNQRYRYLFAPNGSLNDAPVIKALLFLLTHDVFEGMHLGPKDKDNIAVWRSILGAAVVLEEEMRRA